MMYYVCAFHLLSGSVSLSLNWDFLPGMHIWQGCVVCVSEITPFFWLNGSRNLSNHLIYIPIFDQVKSASTFCSLTAHLLASPQC